MYMYPQRQSSHTHCISAMPISIIGIYYMDIYICIYIYVCICIYIYMYVYICIIMYMYIYVKSYVYVYIRYETNHPHKRRTCFFQNCIHPNGICDDLES